MAFTTYWLVGIPSISSKSMKRPQLSIHHPDTHRAGILRVANRVEEMQAGRSLRRPEVLLDDSRRSRTRITPDCRAHRYEQWLHRAFDRDVCVRNLIQGLPE
ncbi:hypothetical protein [Burkholderia sp. BE12]|uniref:hypothetical protein n=1 Tax=Burkholderia sp. BE12 TaxID=2082394 RepID=UPI00131A12FF|nr:hypothetical protein [Burkholderia sp. BE12]